MSAIPAFWGKPVPSPPPTPTRDVYLLCYQPWPDPDFPPLYRTRFGTMVKDPRQAEHFPTPEAAFTLKQELGLINLKVVVVALPEGRR